MRKLKLFKALVATFINSETELFAQIVYMTTHKMCLRNKKIS